MVYNACTNERYWKLPGAKTEARVRRLHWTQELSRRPTTQCQILAAMFGDVPFEEPRVSNQGRIIRPTTGWAERILEDIRSIKETVDGADDLIQELHGRWMRLVCDTLEAEGFQKFDMAEIRARDTTVCIPPWYGTTKPREEEGEDEEELELRWNCDHHDEEIPTETCTAKLATWRALSLHRRRAHRLGLLITKRFRKKTYAQIVSLTFACKTTARKHLISAHKRSIHHRVAGAPEEDVMCAECGGGVSGLSHYLALTRTHLPRPPPIVTQANRKCQEQVHGNFGP